MTHQAPRLELQWLKNALAMAHTAVYEWDIKSGKITWSENTHDVFGIKDADILNLAEDFESMIDGASRGSARKKRITGADGSETEHEYQIDYEIHLPGNRKLSICETGRQVRNGKGVLVKLVGTIFPRAAAVKDKLNSELIMSAFEEEYHYPSQFMQAIEEACANHIKNGRRVGALVIVSVENMPMIVSGYGSNRAEKIISELKTRVQSVLSDDCQMFRIQRDQFAIIMPEKVNDQVTARTRLIVDCMKRFGMKSKISPLHIVPSYGIAFFTESHSNRPMTIATSCIDRAYVALRTNSQLLAAAYEDDDYDTGSKTASIKQMELANYIHTAIHENKLQLAYQPIVSARTGAIAHYECLLRLRGEDGTLSSAGALIPVAERMGLIDIIDQTVLEMVVEDLHRAPDVNLAFNISNLTTTNSEWMEIITRILEATPDIARRMTVEITETAAQRDLKDTAYFVASLQEMGCKVALDDFGSGYTSFRQLKALSCDMIKIDGSFIRDIEKNPDNRFFVKTLLEFTHGFGLDACAEMVETGEAAKILMDLGVEYMQGYYFSQPLNERAWLKESKK